MANELNIALSTGQTVTARLIQAGAYVGSAIALAESPASSGFYTGNVPGGTSAGTYEVLFLSGTANAGSGRLFWSGAAEIDIRTVDAKVLDAAGIRTAVGLATNNLDTQLGAIATDIDSALVDTTAIKAKTDQLAFTSGDVRATLDGEAVTVSTNNDKTGYALTQAFPANFAALGINASGHLSRVTLVDTTTTNTDMRGTNNALLASSYTAPPSSSAIASAVEAQLSEEFDAIPTASENAAAVRTNLTTELARLDANVSSRSDFDADSDRVDIGAVQGVPVVDIDDFKADVSGIETGLETVGDAVGRIDAYTTKRSDIEGLTTGVSADVAAPVDEATPGYIRTSNDSVDVEIIQVSDTVRRVQPSV